MPVPVGEQVLADVLVFIRDRLYGWLRDQGLPHDAVNAALAERAFDLSAATATARDLAELVKSSDWPEVFTAYARCKRIVRNLTEIYPLAPELHTEEATKELYEAYESANGRMGESVAALAEVMQTLKEPINRFFANVLVNTEDPAVRRARLALVQRIAALPEGIADLSLLQGF